MAAVPSIGRASLVEAPRVAPQAAATQGLYERHASKIQSYCQHQLGSREEAEDAVQTTFMNAFRALGRGVVPEAESAWLFKIAENVCLSRRRSSWRRGRIESPSDFGVIEEIVPGPSLQRDELIGIEDALASMPEQQRRAILLREWQGLSYREIATELEVSQSAVETLIFRARRSLAQGLEQPDSIKPAKRKSFRRALHALDLGTVLAALKTLLAGSAAVKATAAVVAVTAVAGTAATVAPKLETKAPVKAPAKALVAPAPAKSTSSFSTGSTADRTVAHASKPVATAAPRHPGKQLARPAASHPVSAPVVHHVAPVPTAPLADEPLGPVAAPAPVQPAPAPAEQPVAEHTPTPAPTPEKPKHEQVTPLPTPEPTKRTDEGKQDEGKIEVEKRGGNRAEPAPLPQPGGPGTELPEASSVTAPATPAEQRADAKAQARDARNDRRADRRADDVRTPTVQPVAPVTTPALTKIVYVAAPAPVAEPVAAPPAPEPAPAPVAEQRSGDTGNGRVEDRDHGGHGKKRNGR